MQAAPIPAPVKPCRILRYALLHVPLWLLATLFVLLIYYDFTAPFFSQLLVTMLGTAMAAIPTYYTIYRLLPRYLYARRIGAFIGRTLLVILTTTFSNYIIGTVLYHIMTGHPLFRSVYLLVYVLLIIFATNVAAVTLGCALSIISNRFRMEDRLQVIEAEKISTELAFLRAQVNPHFLFNVLNTIYFQINRGNTTARGSIEKLSELLRYQLYECNTDLIDIERELTYIRNFVSIQQMRMEPGTDISLVIEHDLGSFRIAPLLILPLVENAFKHISHYKEPSQNQLHIWLRTAGRQLIIFVRNTYDPEFGAKHLVAAGGLGLQNLRRRLDLLYPNRHAFEVRKESRTFEATLKINYDD